MNPAVLPTWQEQQLRLDERRRVLRLVTAHIEAGDYVLLQKALTDLRERKTASLFVGLLLNILESETKNVEPYVSQVDRWLGASVTANSGQR